MELLRLFICFIQIGLFSFGGGYAAMPLIQLKVVDQYHWLSITEFSDLVTIAEMTPGPIIVNGATFIGLRIAGIPGAIIATLGSILPSLIIVSLIFFVYKKYKDISIFKKIMQIIRPIIILLIARAGFSILMQVVFEGKEKTIPNINYIGIALFIIAFISLRKFKLNPILVMFCCGALNLLLKLTILP